MVADLSHRHNPRWKVQEVSVRGGAELEVRADESGSNTAVVIGGGVAGITAARALSPHFKRVVLVERDRPEAYQVLGMTPSRSLHTSLAL